MNKLLKPVPKFHFNNFMKLISLRRPFTFIRFSDGEVEVLRNRKLIISNQKTIFRGKISCNNFPKMDSKIFNPQLHQKFRRDLLEASIFKSKYFYKGIRTFNITDPEATNDREFLLRLNGGFDNQITFSDLLINQNYIIFRKKLLPLLFKKFKDITVISNWRSNLKFSYHKHIKVSDNFISNYEYELQNVLSQLIDIPRNSLVLSSASSLTNIVGYKLFLYRKDITFLDIGTSINELLSLPMKTRGYHELLDFYKTYHLPIRFFKLFFNDLIIRW